MLHLEAVWPSKQNILIAATIVAEPDPWPGFKVWGQDRPTYLGKIILFLSYVSN